MTEFQEAIKGFTDLPICIFALILGIILLKKYNQKDFAILFFIITVSSAMGAFVHCIELSRIGVKIFWMFLYPILYDAVRLFSLLFIGLIKGKKQTESKTVYITETVLLIINYILMWFVTDKDILVLVVFMAFMLARVVVALFKTKRISKKIIIFLILLCLPVLCQALEEIIPYAVAIEHLFIIIDMYFAFSLAKSQKQ